MENNAVMKLLSYDRADIKRDKEVFKMALSKFDGAVFEFEIVQISAQQAFDIRDTIATYDNATGAVLTHSYKPKARTIIEGCPSTFKNQELRKHYGCNTFEELVGLLLTPTEIEKLSKAIQNLSDVDLEAFEVTEDEAEVKN